MYNTTLMSFTQSYSNKYKQYTSIHREGNTIYSIPLALEQFSGLGVINGITYISDTGFTLVDAHKLHAKTLSHQEIQNILDDVEVEAKDCTLVEGSIITLGDGRCVFIEDDITYIADYEMKPGVPLDVLMNMEPVYIPYDIAICIAVNKGLTNVEYDGSYVYSGSKAYTVNELNIVTLPRNFVDMNNNKVVIPVEEINRFRIKHIISKFEDPKNKLRSVEIAAFGRNVDVKVFTRNGFTIADYIYGSPEVYIVQQSAEELGKLQHDAIKYIGLKSLPDLHKISLTSILG